jgi:uncharacterized protein YabE (DUF348 family)
MNILKRKSLTTFIALICAVSFLITISIIAISTITHADNGQKVQTGRLITIHDRGVEKVILSQAATIGDAIKEAGISLDDKDTVEPAVGEKLIASDYQVNIYRARPVIIVDGNIRQKVITSYQTAEQITKSVGIDLYPEDLTTIDRVNNSMEGVGIQLTIKRATPFSFTLYGKTTIVRTQGKTVGEMLSEKNIKLSSNDHLSVDTNTKISPSLIVKLWREGKQTITVDEAVDFEIEKIENADREVSYREVKTAGEKGQRSVTYEVVIQDGQEVSRKEIASLTIKPSKKQVEIVGVKGQYTTPSENETITWDYLTTHGYSRVQTAGIMGNLMQEHGFNTSGDGLAQWTGSRKAELYRMPYPGNIYTQLEFLVHELSTNYASIGNAIKVTDSLTEAVQIFQNRFEKCGICRESGRIEFARNILASH